MVLLPDPWVLQIQSWREAKTMNGLGWSSYGGTLRIKPEQNGGNEKAGAWGYLASRQLLCQVLTAHLVGADELKISTCVKIFATALPVS